MFWSLFIFITMFFSCCQANYLTVLPDVTVVIFGATGDLAARKLYPALYNLDKDGALSPNFTILGVGRRDWSEAEFHQSVYNSLHQFSRNKPTDQEWEAFKAHLVYQRINFSEISDYTALKNLVSQQRNVIYYLATESSYFRTIIEYLHKKDLVQQNGNYARVIIEKPFGEDLDSAIALQEHISKHLDEDQIYRMDHYLGKEGLFKLIKFRFEDAPYEAYLNKEYVSNIQMTLSETIGIGTRANFYEKTGHLRDVIQNHAMQLYAFAAMEMPKQFNQNNILAEKAKALNAIRPLTSKDVIRGQYVGYRHELGVSADSMVETFMQMRMFIDNERWSGVPFYIRSGKRLPEQLTQVKYSFKVNPLNLEAITIVIQPTPRILITRDGLTEPYLVELNPVLERREGYENQLLAGIMGDKTGFVALDETLSTWSLLTPVLNQWINDPEIPFYQAGDFAPSEAVEQVRHDGFEWKL